MLSTLTIIYGIFAMALLILWTIKNNKKKNGSESSGLFGIKENEDFRKKYGDKFPF